MKLIDLLLSDLERHYFYNGKEGVFPRKRDLYKCFLIPRCMLATSYRLSYFFHKKKLTPIGQLICWLSVFVFGSEINCKLSIGPHLYFPHSTGIVLGAESIGSYAVIYHQVTIGAERIEFGKDNRPVLGDHITIGAGAKVLGNIVVPSYSLITANKVVTKKNLDQLKRVRP